MNLPFVGEAGWLNHRTCLPLSVLLISGSLSNTSSRFLSLEPNGKAF